MSIDTEALRITAERGEATVCQQTDALPHVIDFETFAAMRGASRLDYCHDGAISPAGHMPRANWRRVMQTVADRNADLAKRRSELWEEYQLMVAEGKVRQPTRIERLIEAANGHEDRAQTHAARRVLAKRGIDWRAKR